VVLAAGILMGAGVVGLRSHQLRHGEAGRLFTLAEARSMVEFSPRGRSPLFFEDTWRSLSNDRSGLALDPPTLGLLAIALAAVAAAGRRRVAPSPAAIAMALAGVTLWAVARYLVFLYQPVRFVVVTLPLVAALAGGANLALAVGRIPGRAGRASAWAAVTLGMVIAFAPRIYASHVTASPPALFAALRGTPADALVAGPPLMLDFVPAFAERRVLVSDEMMPPMFVRRYQTVRGLMAAMLTAYTASEPEEVDRFCREHGVTHWIVDGDDFDPRATWSYFPPFDEIVVTARRRGPPFALAEAARGRELPGAAPYAIVPCPLPAAPTRGAPASQPPS
jgi:hypothetical protein